MASGSKPTGIWLVSSPDPFLRKRFAHVQQNVYAGKGLGTRLDMAAILELQSVPLVSFRKKTGRASYRKKREHVKLR